MKKAILLVSFGTTYDDARESCIESIVTRVKEKYSDADVFYGFTSRIVLSRLKARGIDIMSEVSAMEMICQKGYEEVVVQPLHLVHGQEFEKLKKNVLAFQGKGALKQIYLGRPLLYYMGQEGKPDDYEILIDKMSEKLDISKDEGVIFVGHGGNNPGNAAYSVLQMKLWLKGYFNARIVTLESFPYLEDTVKPWYGHKAPRKLHVYLLLLVAGDHANNDIFGEEEDSVVNILSAEGHECMSYPYGLGSLPEVADIFIQHMEDAIQGAV